MLYPHIADPTNAQPVAYYDPNIRVNDVDVDGLTAYVAEFLTRTRASDIPADVMHLGKRSILDGLGLALAGNAAESGHLVRKYFKALGIPTDRGATVIGTGMKLPARFAAFADGVAIHADDYDDTQLAVAKDRVYGLLTHPTASVLPVVLALGERDRRSGLVMLTAYEVAVEAETKISEAINPRHYDDGFHSTATVGTIAAAAAASRMMGFDVEQTRRALSIGASQSAGLRENFGTMTKPFHPGRGAESGIVAADFAKLGWTAAPSILEANRGFFKAAGGGFDPNAIDGKLGNPWTFAFPGVSIKPHPSGSLTHPGMGLMLDLIRKHDIRPGDVVKVSVGTNRHMPNALIHHRPTTELQAKFSMEFCMAILLLERKGGLNEFTDEIVNRPDVQAMIRKVEFGVHPEAEAAGDDKMTTILEIALTDGRMIRDRADFGKGSPAIPMSYDEVADKFRECATYSRWPKGKTERVVEVVQHLEDMKDVRELSGLLSRSTTGVTAKKIPGPAARARVDRKRPGRPVRTGKSGKVRGRSR